MIEFHRVPPENIQFLPFKAIKYIEGAIQRTPANVTRLDVVLDVISKGNGDLYLVSKDDDITGITYLVSYPTQEETMLGIILLGGDHIASWIPDYRKFIRAYMDSADINKLMFIGRKGWVNLFPDARITGYVCEIIK